MDTERWLTVGQIAEEMQVTNETVRRWLRSGRLKGRNFGGKMGYRVQESNFQAFAATEVQTWYDTVVNWRDGRGAIKSKRLGDMTKTDLLEFSEHIDRQHNLGLKADYLPVPFGWDR